MFELAWNSPDGSYFKNEKRFCARNENIVLKRKLGLCALDPEFPSKKVCFLANTTRLFVSLLSRIAIVHALVS